CTGDCRYLRLRCGLSLFQGLQGLRIAPQRAENQPLPRQRVEAVNSFDSLARLFILENARKAFCGISCEMPPSGRRRDVCGRPVFGNWAAAAE
ncbi:MAG: hypothetical protein ACOX64_13050, partial [Candidatus Merdivicinus sp.]